MSRTAAKDFMSTVAEDQQMQQSLGEELTQASDPIAATSRFAKQHGFEVEPEDLKLEKALRRGELADNELEAVSGGTLSSFSFSSRGIIIIGGKTGLGGASLDEQGIIVIGS